MENCSLPSYHGYQWQLYSPWLRHYEDSRSCHQRQYQRGGGGGGGVCKKKRPRTAFSKAQISKLEEEFTVHKYLTVAKRQELSEYLKLTENQIKIWFQNRRTKWKRDFTNDLDIAIFQHQMALSMSNGWSSSRGFSTRHIYGQSVFDFQSPRDRPTYSITSNDIIASTHGSEEANALTSTTAKQNDRAIKLPVVSSLVAGIN
uniref:Homeobox protein Hox-B3-like n=1 Tax=Saccoglossus kowalevskii TaxID=10224 RepID=A0ABM0LUG1_SACKO|nr:PREDICTED: homeobox protein Hox-B3-like [Saccoglossus kowalevskii]